MVFPSEIRICYSKTNISDLWIVLVLTTGNRITVTEYIDQPLRTLKSQTEVGGTDANLNRICDGRLETAGTEVCRQCTKSQCSILLLDLDFPHRFSEARSCFVIDLKRVHRKTQKSILCQHIQYNHASIGLPLSLESFRRSIPN